jgi:hypothetical protein
MSLAQHLHRVTARCNWSRRIKSDMSQGNSAQAAARATTETNETKEVIAIFASEDRSARLCGASRDFCGAPQSSGAPSLRWQQSPQQQMQVRQREGGVQPCGFLRQPTVENPGKAPQALNRLEGMLDAGASNRAAAVNEALICAQRPLIGAPIDPVTDAASDGALAMRLVPINLIAEGVFRLERIDRSQGTRTAAP